MLKPPSKTLRRSGPRPVRRWTAIAAACVMAGPPAWAAVLPTGAIVVSPATHTLAPGLLAPDAFVDIGQPGVGRLVVDGGSFMQLAGLRLGLGAAGSGEMVLTGPGTRLDLVGSSGRAGHQTIYVGNWGQGRLDVLAGAVLDGRGNTAPCLLTLNACNSSVGSASGGNGRLTISGAGSAVLLPGSLFVSVGALTTLSQGGYVAGTPGAVTQGRIDILDGGLLRTDQAQVAPRQWGAANMGNEFNFAVVNLNGAGSRWEVTGGQSLSGTTGQVMTAAAQIITANDRNSKGDLNLTQGGVISIGGLAGVVNRLDLATGDSGPGQSNMLISGSGSKVEFTGPNATFHVGRFQGQGMLNVTEGGVIEGVYYFAVGRSLAQGSLVVDGADSRISVTRFAEAAVVGANNRAPRFDVGRGSTGTATLRNGALVEVAGGAESSATAPALLVGTDNTGVGTLNIQSGARFAMRSTSLLAGGGPGEAHNPYAAIGHTGTGALNITAGGKLSMEGGAVSTTTDRRGTAFIVGGRDDTSLGGRGFATVSGAGSELRVSGSDPTVWVGRGPQASGQLNVRLGGLVQATNLLVGRHGAVGVMSIDAATVRLAGQQVGSLLAGASAAVGSGAGSVGVLNISNAGLLDISNNGAAAVAFRVGGTESAAGGDGSLNMSSGARIQLSSATPGNASFTIGHDGGAFARLAGGSQIDVGTGALYVGRLNGGDGTLIVGGGSSVSASWVGVGRNQTATGHADGGTGTVVINGGTLNAVDVVIGTNGFLGGTAGSINVSGSVTNFGIFSPGNSPGTFTINGAFNAGAGSRLVLEVQSDGAGGFSTDRVLFSDGAALNFGGMTVEFRFLGDTDPRAFQAGGGFGLDTFVARQAPGGGSTGLDPTLWSTATFTAQSDAYVFTAFNFNAASGATFNAVPVPEPAGWALMLAGLGLLLRHQSRLRRSGGAKDAAMTRQ